LAYTSAAKILVNNLSATCNVFVFVICTSMSTQRYDLSSASLQTLFWKEIAQFSAQGSRTS